ncbi:hypothetical protein ACHAXH_004638, partial [Discostella pseudostelligera]
MKLLFCHGAVSPSVLLLLTASCCTTIFQSAAASSLRSRWLPSDTDGWFPLVSEFSPSESSSSRSDSSSSGAIGAVHATSDEATTYTGQPIAVDVLLNDYIADAEKEDDDNDNNISATTSMLFTPLFLSEIVADGEHGTCSIIESNKDTQQSMLLYTPDATAYSGPDKCGYKVCLEKSNVNDAENCDYATLFITIAKQVEQTEIVAASHDDDDDEALGGDDFISFTVDPDTLLTEDVWEEVYEMTPPIETTNFEDGIPFTNPTDCPANETLFSIEIQTDKHGEDVTWELYSLTPVSTGVVRKKILKKGGSYDTYSYDMIETCLASPAKYGFTIYDAYGDGVCDYDRGICGYYKLYLDGREIVHVTHYGYNNTNAINVGFDPTPSMTTRHMEYLVAHNIRRREWHEKYNTSYVPLLWSPRLADDSLRWALKLLDDCEVPGVEHEPGVAEGENLAKNLGLEYENGTASWGQLYPPENIVQRWVEREAGWDYPKNAHLTQALWRSSKYLGCGESEKNYPGGKCRVQVCRYARAGNCDMTRFNATEGENWLTPMLKDSSP